jgi:hypothetical protein
MRVGLDIRSLRTYHRIAYDLIPLIFAAHYQTAVRSAAAHAD